ncbi:MAG TPA: NADH-quinone oxidoreductase subunit J [Actinomycetota bacterium]|nr:NADH-quinone oxidoreductase subunit J [Actinomycetota bacterium]
MEKYIFWVVAFLSLGSAILMIRARNPIHSALLLVMNFFTLAVFYVLLDAHFLAAVQVIVYAGAIMVLFLFVIMLLGVDREDVVEERIPLQYPLAIILGLVFAGIAVWTIHTTVGGTAFEGVEAANRGGNVEAVGRVLFTKYMFPFEVASVLLIVAAIGAMVLGRRRDEEERASMIGESTPEGREPSGRQPAPVGEER